MPMLSERDRELVAIPDKLLENPLDRNRFFGWVNVLGNEITALVALSYYATTDPMLTPAQVREKLLSIRMSENEKEFRRGNTEEISPTRGRLRFVFDLLARRSIISETATGRERAFTTVKTPEGDENFEYQFALKPLVGIMLKNSVALGEMRLSDFLSDYNHDDNGPSATENRMRVMSTILYLGADMLPKEDQEGFLNLKIPDLVKHSGMPVETVRKTLESFQKLGFLTIQDTTRDRYAVAEGVDSSKSYYLPEGGRHTEPATQIARILRHHALLSPGNKYLSLDQICVAMNPQYNTLDEPMKTHYRGRMIGALGRLINVDPQYCEKDENRVNISFRSAARMANVVSDILGVAKRNPEIILEGRIFADQLMDPTNNTSKQYVAKLIDKAA